MRAVLASHNKKKMKEMREILSQLGVEVVSQSDVGVDLEPEEDTLFADRAGSYQRYQGKKLVDRFDAYSYWYLTEALDSQNVGRGRGGVEAALSRIQANCMMISIDSDVLFPPSHGRATVAALKSAQYRELSSRFGHDGFLIETEQLTGILLPFLEKYMKR